jgi:hypothetical protein
VVGQAAWAGAVGACKAAKTSRARYRFKHRMISFLTGPGWSVEPGIRGSADASQPDHHDPVQAQCWPGGSHPGFRRCRTVLPDDAGIGEAPHSIENAASLRSRRGYRRRRQQRPGRSAAHPNQLPEFGCRLGGQPIKLSVHPGELAVHGLGALAHQAQGQLGRCGRGQDRSWPQARCCAGQLAAGRSRRCSRSAAGRSPPAPAARWRPGCGPWPRWCWPPAGRAPSPPDGRRSWDGGRLAGLHRPGRGLGIDRVGRATPVAGLAVRPVDVPPHLALSGQEADQPSTVAASPSTPQASTSPRLRAQPPTPDSPGGVVATRVPATCRPNWSRAPATCRSPWGSTPTVTLLGSGVCDGGAGRLPAGQGSMAAPAERADNTATSLGDRLLTC